MKHPRFTKPICFLFKFQGIGSFIKFEGTAYLIENTTMLRLRLPNSGLRELPNISTLNFEEIDIQGNYLHSLDNLPLLLKSLNGSRNSLINDGIFFPFPRLEHLNLSRNRINIFEDDNFIQCYPSLITLDFSYNCLKYVSFLVESNLESLNISHNRIQLVSGLPLTLKELIADSNEITMIQSKLPPRLVHLDFSYNLLRYAGLPLNWPATLRELHLDKNNIERFPRKLPDSLEVLTLCGNNLKELPSLLPASLSCLLVSSNRIRHIPDYKNHKKFNIFLINDNCLTETPTNFNALVTNFEQNWHDDKHHSAQRILKKCWKRYVITLRLRHLIRTKKIQEELFMVSMMPERWQQVDVIDPVWYRN